MAKKFFSVMMAFAMLSVVGLTSCSDDDDPVDPNPPSGEEYELPANGVVDAELFETYDKVRLTSGNNYVLMGGVQLEEGQVITIEQGVTVKSDPDEPTPAYLLIGPGAQIFAEGTASEPIVFTSGKSSPRFQDWGGIIICGRAPVNAPGGTLPSEMGEGVSYGGDDADDNSGVLKYVRVEYTGAKKSATAEHNGFTFEGVGSGTAVDYLCSFEGGDDGIEFFGGTVNAKHLIVVGPKDDMFDWTFGWTGRAQYLVGIQADDVADRGIEADNNEDGHTLEPYSNPTISNLVLVGSTLAQTGDDPLNPGAGASRVMELRRGTKARIYNAVAYGFINPVRLSNDATLDNMQDGSLLINNGLFNFAAGKSWTYAPGEGDYTGAKPFEAAESNNTFANTSNAAPAGITDKYKGMLEADKAIDPKTVDSWFETAKFKGAVDPANDWTAGNWARFE